MAAMAQMGFFDLSDRYTSLDAKRDPLAEINEIVPWEEFRPLLEQVWRKPESERKSRAGRKVERQIMRQDIRWLRARRACSNRNRRL